jgi:hypothetical protein
MLHDQSINIINNISPKKQFPPKEKEIQIPCFVNFVTECYFLGKENKQSIDSHFKGTIIQFWQKKSFFY